ncbi:MAG: hypothetical protein ACOZAR_04155 [Patescibacteria group bacterium]
MTGEKFIQKFKKIEKAMTHNAIMSNPNAIIQELCYGIEDNEEDYREEYENYQAEIHNLIHNFLSQDMKILENEIKTIIQNEYAVAIGIYFSKFAQGTIIDQKIISLLRKIPEFDPNYK